MSHKSRSHREGLGGSQGDSCLGVFAVLEQCDKASYISSLGVLFKVRRELQVRISARQLGSSNTPRLMRLRRPRSVRVILSMRRKVRVNCVRKARVVSSRCKLAPGSDHRRVQCSKFESLHFASRSFGKLRNELHPARTLVSSQILSHPVLQLLREAIAFALIGIQHHVGSGLKEPVCIFAGDYCGFEHGGM